MPSKKKRLAQIEGEKKKIAKTYFADQDYRSHKLITWSGQEITN
jgi:Zn/Cd-binding protein ZinT